MPPRDVRLYLSDTIEACDAIAVAIDGRTIDDFTADRLLRSSLERELSIIGEAVSQMLKQDPTLEQRITDAWAIVRFRNLLIHVYHLMDLPTVWDILTVKVPVLREEAESILRSLGSA
jgi:uncharacterized protein with HEPN domain